MRVLLTGSNGQLGRALRASLPKTLAGERVELIPTARRSNPKQGVIGLDLADKNACRAAIFTYKPDWVLNAGAYTAVDRAETEPELAHAINANAPCTFAETLSAINNHSRLLQISTDFVFSGEQGCPYKPEDPLKPLNVYGASKAEGEKSIELINTQDHRRGTVIRTSWLYGPTGKNFLLTMMRLHHEKAARKENLYVVADQVGCPTSTRGLAEACWAVMQNKITGIIHWCDAGVASWYDFAVAIGEIGIATGALEHSALVRPIRTADYSTAARRPSYSLLDTTSTSEVLALAPRDWRLELQEVLKFYKFAQPEAG